ncbi:MAG: DUF1330 domain-containing protein [Betaproteobacteria bacterium]|jgi:uncharacterized protein (DUF1330 family)
MAAYLVSLITVTDPDKFKEYAALTAAAGAKYNGKFVTRGGGLEVVEGVMPHARVVITEFKDKETAKAFFESPEYLLAKEKRIGACDFNAFIVEGV